MSQEQLYASFLLDKEEGLEIALLAESVTEATAITSAIRPLPTTVNFLEGMMHLRDAAIPVINLKKRMGLEDTGYNPEAKVAVVKGGHQRYGLLFDDIKEVFRAESTNIVPIREGMLSEDRLITSLLHLEQGARTIDLLNLDHVFLGEDQEKEIQEKMPAVAQEEPTTYTKYIVFNCLGQNYGVPVELAQEMTFISKVDDRYQEDFIDGVLSLRGSSIPVIGAKYLLADCYEELHKATEDYRVLVFKIKGCSFGLVVEHVREILNVPDNRVLPIPMENERIVGVYSDKNRENIMLLNIEKVLGDHCEAIKAKFRLNKYQDLTHDDIDEAEAVEGVHHLITENGYLVFSIGKHFGMEIKDVQEILDNAEVMRTPGLTGAQKGVINLRGQVIPVICLRTFLDYPGQQFETDERKHIICRGSDSIIALEVDSIVTIYKQEEFHMTPSLNPEWAKKKDVLDRLIEFMRDDGLREHVLILNTDNLVNNHFSFNGQKSE